MLDYNSPGGSPWQIELVSPGTRPLRLSPHLKRIKPLEAPDAPLRELSTTSLIVNNDSFESRIRSLSLPSFLALNLNPFDVRFVLASPSCTAGRGSRSTSGHGNQRVGLRVSGLDASALPYPDISQALSSDKPTERATLEQCFHSTRPNSFAFTVSADTVIRLSMALRVLLCVSCWGLQISG